MKRWMCVLLAVMLFFAAAKPALAADAPYTVVIPLAYDQITEVYDGFFVTSHADSTWYNLYDLHATDGTVLLSDLTDVYLLGDYFIVGKPVGDTRKYGIYGKDIRELVPCAYDAIVIPQAGVCMAMQGKIYHRSGDWEGDWQQYDLNTGRKTGEPFTGWELDYTNYISRYPAVDARILAAVGESGVTIVTKGGEDENGFADGWGATSIKAYNNEGQLLLDFGPYLGNRFSDVQAGCGGTVLYGYADHEGESYALNYVFSGRGRLIAEQYGSGFSAPQGYGGEYILAYGCDGLGTKARILDRNGQTVIPAGEFDTYYFYNYNSGGGNFCATADPKQIIVGKDGKYGVITLAERKASPSSWAKEEINAASSLGIVPEGSDLWWQDPCTRKEFCRILALALEKVTEKSIAKNAANAYPVNFNDCANQDVLAAAALGIVKGMGNGTFNPDHFITRQEAAVMLSRACVLLTIGTTREETTYSDVESFAPWAVEGIDYVSHVYTSSGVSLMQGVGNSEFAPVAAYTVEQSVLTLLRLTRAGDKKN